MYQERARTVVFEKSIDSERFAIIGNLSHCLRESEPLSSKTNLCCFKKAGHIPDLVRFDGLGADQRRSRSCAFIKQVMSAFSQQVMIIRSSNRL